MWGSVRLALASTCFTIKLWTIFFHTQTNTSMNPSMRVGRFSGASFCSWSLIKSWVFACSINNFWVLVCVWFWLLQQILPLWYTLPSLPYHIYYAVFCYSEREIPVSISTKCSYWWEIFLNRLQGFPLFVVLRTCINVVEILCVCALSNLPQLVLSSAWPTRE